jgi:pimeloyl-ACP methyl ester carboxylesterase
MTPAGRVADNARELPTAVLVHGGFHGGWCWSRVADGLRARGWRVYAPSLTGLADRAHLASAEIGAETHVQDIVGLIECEELRDVVLCGHSAGAHTATGVADAVPSRIRHFLSVDGLQPAPGESVNDVLGEEHGLPDVFRTLAREHDGVMIPPSVFSAADFGVTEPADAAWVMRRMTPHPLRCFEEPVAVGAGFDSLTSRTFVRCERFPGPYAIRLIDALEQDPGWVTHRWDVGHDAMISAPERLIELLAGLGGEASGAR